MAATTTTKPAKRSPLITIADYKRAQAKVERAGRQAERAEAAYERASDLRIDAQNWIEAHGSARDKAELRASLAQHGY